MRKLIARWYWRQFFVLQEKFFKEEDAIEFMSDKTVINEARKRGYSIERQNRKSNTTSHTDRIARIFHVSDRHQTAERDIEQKANQRDNQDNREQR